jgi:hypothetical protein
MDRVLRMNETPPIEVHSHTIHDVTLTREVLRRLGV